MMVRWYGLVRSASGMLLWATLPMNFRGSSRVARIERSWETWREPCTLPEEPLERWRSEKARLELLAPAQRVAPSDERGRMVGVWHATLNPKP